MPRSHLGRKWRSSDGPTEIASFFAPRASSNCIASSSERASGRNNRLHRFSLASDRLNHEAGAPDIVDPRQRLRAAHAAEAPVASVYPRANRQNALAAAEKV